MVKVEEKCLNKSPVIHLEQRVALESWCIRHLYTFGYELLLQLAARTRKCPDEKSAQEAHQLTRLMLLLNPNLSLAWSIR